MPRVEVDLSTKLDPDRTIAALTDFSDRRPDIWSGLNRGEYEVYDVGDTWAEVREGSNKRIWARERYDWSTPGTVRWTVIDSPFSSTGDRIAVTVRASGSGSEVHISWFRRGKTMTAKAGLAVLSLLIGRMLRRYVGSTMDGIAEGSKPQPSQGR